MAKVMIYEDEVNTILAKYEGLLGKHTIHLRLDRLGKEAVQELANLGFPEINIRDEIRDPSQESADVYLVDGLEGKCFDIFPKLPRARSFLCSDNEDIQEKARARGYNVLENSYDTSAIEEAIQQILSN